MAERCWWDSRLGAKFRPSVTPRAFSASNLLPKPVAENQGAEVRTVRRSPQFCRKQLQFLFRLHYYRLA
jgi:hypothetical protein